MAGPLCNSTTTIIFSIFVIIIIITTTTITPISAKPKTPIQKQKLTHLHFYFHDIVSGPNPTAIRVAAPLKPNNSLTGFGALVMIDDPLTAEPNLGSRIVGRAQGMYGVASETESALFVAMDLVFLEGRFNGSSLSVLGRNDVGLKVREMGVVGGSGVFRWARGYALAKTVEFDLGTGDAIVEYDVFVFHY